MITTKNVSRVDALILKDFEEDLSKGVFSFDRATLGHDYNPIVVGFIYNDTGVKILSSIDKFDSFYILHQHVLDENGARIGKYSHRFVTFDAIVQAYKTAKSVTPIILSSAIADGTPDAVEVYKTSDENRYVLRVTTATSVPASEESPGGEEIVSTGEYELFVWPLVKISQPMGHISETTIAVEDLTAT